jgi:hypothetical protein
VPYRLCKYRYFYISIPITHTYGPSGGWCWLDLHSNKADGKTIHKLVLFYYCFSWLLILINCFFAFKLISIVNNFVTDYNRYLLYSFKFMVLYPIAQIVCFIPATVNRLYNIIMKQEQFTLSIIHTTFDYSLGFIITLIFLLSPNIRYSILSCMRRLRNKNNRTMETSTLSEDMINKTSSFNNNTC